MRLASGQATRKNYPETALGRRKEEFLPNPVAPKVALHRA